MKEKKPTKTYTLKVRLTEHEQAKLEAYAAKHDMSLSRVIREYIRRLRVPSRTQDEKADKHYIDIYPCIDETKVNSTQPINPSNGTSWLDTWEPIVVYHDS